MLALRSNTNVDRLVDTMLIYGLVRFGKLIQRKKNLSIEMRYLDVCDQSNNCTCSQKFRNDENHQYILSNSHRLLPKQRLDLIALMHNDHMTNIRQSYSHENLRISSTNNSLLNDENEMIKSEYRRKKSSSLNSPVNSGKDES